MRIVVSLFFFLLLGYVAPTWGQERGWEGTWNDTLASAKKEGKVVLASSPDPAIRKELIPKFTARFGIPVEFVAGRDRTTAAKLQFERRANLYTVDVFMPNLSTPVHILYPEKMLAPLKPMLILPEVVDPSKWKKGKLWFLDPEEKYVLRMFMTSNALFYINTDYVKPSEIRSAKDLLNPKWRGKISSEDPTVAGKATSRAIRFYMQIGEEFFKRLYRDQKPQYSGNRRQIADWLARGTYPICLTCREVHVKALQKEGFKILAVYRLSDIKDSVSASPAVLTAMNKAPHPNAARLFVNWMASKEALETYSRAVGYATLRNDVDESFLPPDVIPDPHGSYLDTADWNWAAGNEKRKIEKRVKDLIRSFR